MVLHIHQLLNQPSSSTAFMGACMHDDQLPSVLCQLAKVFQSVCEARESTLVTSPVVNHPPLSTASWQPARLETFYSLSLLSITPRGSMLAYLPHQGGGKLAQIVPFLSCLSSEVASSHYCNSRQRTLLQQPPTHAHGQDFPPVSGCQ